MGKFKKGNNHGFKKGCKPYMRDKTHRNTSNTPEISAKCLRLSSEMEKLTFQLPKYGLQPQTQTPAENIKLLRPRERLQNNDNLVSDTEKAIR